MVKNAICRISIFFPARSRRRINPRCSQTLPTIDFPLPRCKTRAVKVPSTPLLTRALCPVHMPESVLTAARISSAFLVSISCSSKLTPLFWKILSAPASSRPRTMRLFAAWWGEARGHVSSTTPASKIPPPNSQTWDVLGAPSWQEKSTALTPLRGFSKKSHQGKGRWPSAPHRGLWR